LYWGGFGRAVVAGVELVWLWFRLDEEISWHLFRHALLFLYHFRLLHACRNVGFRFRLKAQVFRGWPLVAVVFGSGDQIEGVV